MKDAVELMRGLEQQATIQLTPHICAISFAYTLGFMAAMLLGCKRHLIFNACVFYILLCLKLVVD